MAYGIVVIHLLHQIARKKLPFLFKKIHLKLFFTFERFRYTQNGLDKKAILKKTESNYPHLVETKD